jgi:capsular polysaccharide biosynthesis protein
MFRGFGSGASNVAGTSVDYAGKSESGPYQATNPIDLPRIDRRTLTSGGRDGIYVEPTNTWRGFQAYPAAFVDDPDQVGLFSQVGPYQYWYPRVYTAAASNASLVGYRTILTSDQKFFTDEAYVEALMFQNQLDRISRPDPFSNEATGLRPTDRPGYFLFDPKDRPCRRVEGNAVVLCSDEPFSYGSFLFRVVPKVVALRDLRLTDATCVAGAQQKPFMDLLAFCGISRASIVQHDVNVVTQIDRALIPCLRNPHAFLDPESCELYAELRAAYGVRPTGRKIYVSRLRIGEAGWSTRIMLNESELIGRLAAIGFDIIEPEELSVQDQIMTFSSASVVVGPSGSGLFNSMFCHPGTKFIDIQSEPQWIYSYAGMYASLQLDYGIFIGRADPADTRAVHRRWTVNIEALIDRILAFTAG